MDMTGLDYLPQTKAGRTAKGALGTTVFLLMLAFATFMATPVVWKMLGITMNPQARAARTFDGMLTALTWTEWGGIGAALVGVIALGILIITWGVSMMRQVPTQESYAMWHARRWGR